MIDPATCLDSVEIVEKTFASDCHVYVLRESPASEKDWYDAKNGASGSPNLKDAEFDGAPLQMQGMTQSTSFHFSDYGPEADWLVRTGERTRKRKGERKGRTEGGTDG